MGIILVNPEKSSHVKKKDAQAFIDWVLSPEGQKAIADYRMGGEQLFVRNAAGRGSEQRRGAGRSIVPDGHDRKVLRRSVFAAVIVAVGLTRLSYLIGIFKALYILYPDSLKVRENSLRFVAGRIPMEA